MDLVQVIPCLLLLAVPCNGPVCSEEVPFPQAYLREQVLGVSVVGAYLSFSAARVCRG